MLISEAFVRKMIKGSKKFDFSTGVSWEEAASGMLETQAYSTFLTWLHFSSYFQVAKKCIDNEKKFT